MQAELAQAAEIDGVPQDAHGFLRGVEAHRVFRHHEVDHELAAAMVVAGGGKLRVGGAVLFRRLDVVDQVDECVKRGVAQGEEAILDVFDAGLEFFFGEVVAGLAGAVDLEQRAVDLVITDLESALPHVRHVAVGAGDAGARVHALVPHLKFRMTRFDELGAGVGERPLVDFLLILDGDDVFHLDALGPGEGEALVGRLEILGDVALAADIRAHFLAGGLRVHVVVRDALRRLQRADAFDEGGARDTQLHG